MNEDDPLRPMPAHEVGMALDTLSVDELEARIGLLEEEIARLREAIAVKSESRAAADAVFSLGGAKDQG